MNADFAIKSLNLVDRSIWATLNVGLALHEAGVLAWRLKLRYAGSCCTQHPTPELPT